MEGLQGFEGTIWNLQRTEEPSWRFGNPPKSCHLQAQVLSKTVAKQRRTLGSPKLEVMFLASPPVSTKPMKAWLRPALSTSNFEAFRQ